MGRGGGSGVGGEVRWKQGEDADTQLEDTLYLVGAGSLLSYPDCKPCVCQFFAIHVS